MLPLPAEEFHLPPILPLRPEVILGHLREFLISGSMATPVGRVIPPFVPELRQEPSDLIGSCFAPLRWDWRRDQGVAGWGLLPGFRGATRGNQDVRSGAAQVQFDAVVQPISMQRAADLRKPSPCPVKAPLIL